MAGINLGILCLLKGFGNFTAATAATRMEAVLLSLRRGAIKLKAGLGNGELPRDP
ncbi:MAG: hypothetical protein Kow0040_09810 [Thermogutta sp.]